MQNGKASFDVIYKQEKYDIKNFLRNHPGGVNYLEPYKEKDVSERMKATQHSKAALYLFKEYKKERKREKDTNKDEQEDLETLVDWTRPMLNQVGSLGTKYKEWVISPVDRHLRLFDNPILESLTITPWYVVPMVWIPVIVYLIKIGANKYTEITKDPSPSQAVVFYFCFGIVSWSLLEYSLHRWVFHIEPSGHSEIMIYVHFAIHGLHHKALPIVYYYICISDIAKISKNAAHFILSYWAFSSTSQVPFDSRRLVFPPFPAAIITLSLYKLVSFVVPQSTIFIFIAGCLSGYVTYDMIHFYLHYGAPKENSYFYHLKRYHNHHHFAHHNSGFGISSVFWDKVFGTAIHLKRLGMGIRW